MDSFAPARSALQAFGSAEFLSPIPIGSSLPRGEGEFVSVYWEKHVAGLTKWVFEFNEDKQLLFPLPAGEGQGEGKNALLL